ncbi:IS4 transposase [Escherichia coli]|nr:IS4 transposase [Escherichia coli]
MPPPSTQLFAEHLPTEWIQHLLTLSAHATICRLNLSADGEAGISLLARSAVTQERQRVGAPGGMALPPDRTDMGRGTLPEG